MSDKTNKSNILTMRNAKGKRKLNRGFIAATAVCLVAVAAAGITTYKNVSNYIDPPEDETRIIRSVAEDSSGESVNANHNLKGIFDSDSHITSLPEIVQPDTDSEQAVETDTQTDTDTDSAETVTETDIDIGTDSSGQIVSDTYLYPTGKEITREYSGDDLIYSKTMNDWRVHLGCDYYAQKGEKVKPITTGTVTQIYNDPLYGVTVVIDHGNSVVAYYSGLGSTTLVNVGDRVEIGDYIGSVNVVPSESLDDPHLHLGIKVNDEWIDPADILDAENSEE